MTPLVQAENTSFSTKIIAGDAAVLARRYASALYALADEQKQLDAVSADLRALRGLYHESAEFQSASLNPRLKRGDLVKAMKQVADVAKFNALTGNFLGLLAQNRRLDLLTGMIDGFLAELAERRGEYSADVRVATALTPAQTESLAAQLRDLAGGKVHLAVREDKSLLGGLVVKMGSRLIDASVKGKLERLERQLKTNTSKGAA